MMTKTLIALSLLIATPALAVELQYSEPPTDGRRPTTVVLKTMGPNAEELTIFGNGARAPFRAWVGDFKRKTSRTEKALNEIKRAANEPQGPAEPADPQAPLIFVDGKFIAPGTPAHEAAVRLVTRETMQPSRSGWQAFETRRVARFPKRLVLEHFKGVRKVESTVLAKEACHETGSGLLTCPTAMGEFSLAK